MASSLSNLVNNPSEGIHDIKWKNGRNDKICETSRINCMSLSCHVPVSEWIYTLQFSEYQETPC